MDPLRVRSLAQGAAQSLRHAIISGQLKPGERLIELKLAASLGIGQPTLREALKELEHQGFVRKVPNRGTYVTSLTRDDLSKIHEVRLTLEALAFEKAARNMTSQAARELEGIVATMDDAARRLDRVAFHNSDLEFHRKVWKLAGNEYLEMVLERIVFGMFAFVLSEEGREDFLASVGQHRNYLAGLLSGDPPQAVRVFRESTRAFWRRYHLSEPGDLQPPALTEVGITRSGADTAGTPQQLGSARTWLSTGVDR
ncbi:MAG: GntR family transcriptional regulator [Acidobacteria bacterium]|nr:GntR family transcriptional regulator [Acidobacteriota bacterium]